MLNPELICEHLCEILDDLEFLYGAQDPGHQALAAQLIEECTRYLNSP